MVNISDGCKNPSKGRKGILIKRKSPSQEMAIHSPETTTSSTFHEDTGGYDSKDYGFMSKLKQNFNYFKPILNNDMGMCGDDAKQGKKLSPSEARKLSEYGAHLSENNGDHEAAIVTLMRVRTISFNISEC